jgi:SAM-dependent methyltransferase
MEKHIYQQFYELEKDHWWFRGMRYLCKSAIIRYCADRPTGPILDIGCGTGLLTKSLEDLGEVVGADNSEDALEFCRRRGINNLVRTSAESPEFGDNSFSIIVAFGLIEHLDKDKVFLEETNRMLKEGGYLILLTSAYRFLWGAHDDTVHHKRRYTLGQIKRMAKDAGFSARKASYVNTFLFIPIAAARMAQNILGFRSGRKGGHSDITKANPFINAVLYRVLQAEAQIMKMINYPFGVGILFIGKKERADALH